MTPAQEVSAILKRRKWTPYRLAIEAEIHPSTVARIVKGANVTHATLEKIRTAGKARK